MVHNNKTIFKTYPDFFIIDGVLVQLARKRRKGKRFRRSHAPYLAKIRFYWCDTCNVPRIADTSCSICHAQPREVQLSPPGDPFPAMDGHLENTIFTIDAQFGRGVGEKILPPNKTIVMNKVSSLDAMYEVILDGQIIGRLRYDIPKKRYKFILSLEGGRRIGEISHQKWVTCDDGVLKFLKNGANLLVPGIIGCDSEIEVGDEVWVTDTNGVVIAVGIARMTGSEIAQSEKGFAIKIREVDDPRPPNSNNTLASWDVVVTANTHDLDKIESEAMGFVKKISFKNPGKIVVGFSGGKDSLATYLVVEKALEETPKLFFVDTGIELPETVEYIREFAKSRGVEIIGEEAGERFWESLATFGPPARDFRWCCKVLKLGPAATSISEKLDGETLSFMGQRKLESFKRSIEPRVSSNPWVPGQKSANPIQNWNALEVWLYIFREKAPFNPLYNQGYHRMGCYLCPSSPLAELDRLKKSHPALYQRWRLSLLEWAEKFGYPEEWVDHGFWRWKKLPQGQLKVINKMGLDIASERGSTVERLELDTAQGVAPCTSTTYSLEGQFNQGLDLNRVSKITPIFGKSRMSEELGALKINAGENTISLFSSGSLVIRGEDDKLITMTAERIERAVKRALFCQACGSCVPQCEQGALSLTDGKICVDKEKCTGCLQCDNWPCPTYLT